MKLLGFFKMFMMLLKVMATSAPMVSMMVLFMMFLAVFATPGLWTFKKLHVALSYPAPLLVLRIFCGSAASCTSMHG